MSGLHYDNLEQMPDGLRKIVEKQMNKTTAEQTYSPPTIQTGPSTPKRKYNNEPTDRLLPNGECIKFGSKKEANYYDQLVTMRAAGIVRKIRLQEEFLLKPAYTDGDTGERFQSVKYLADFTFERMEDGKWVRHIIDTKGGRATKTPTYRLKRKLMAEQGHIIEEV